jgi:hypothetical protein
MSLVIFMGRQEIGRVSLFSATVEILHGASQYHDTLEVFKAVGFPNLDVGREQKEVRRRQSWQSQPRKSLVFLYVIGKLNSAAMKGHSKSEDNPLPQPGRRTDRHRQPRSVDPLRPAHHLRRRLFKVNRTALISHQIMDGRHRMESAEL